jgi:ATP-dependent Clp protease ATP-binding subunit ClpA
MRTKPATTLDPTRRGNAAADFEQVLRRNIIGQEQAIAAAVEVFQTCQAGLNPPGRPLGNLLFLGPTGCGKTRVAEAMAQALYGDPHAIVKVDCAEFQHSHEIAKLIGSPPGYLGHRETHAFLCQETLDQMHTDTVKVTILLFDEIEKASDTLWQLLLGVLDKATLTLGDNRRVNLSRCIIIMTSNLGAREMSNLVQGGLGFAPESGLIEAKFDDKIDRSAIDAARRKFTPEFMNRLDKMVVFKTLRPEHLRHILEIELGMVQQRIQTAAGDRRFVFNCTRSVKDFLLQQGTDARYGARHLKRAVEQHLVAPMANLLASAQVRLGDFIRIDRASNGDMIFTREPEAARAANEWEACYCIPNVPPLPPRGLAWR